MDNHRGNGLIPQFIRLFKTVGRLKNSGRSKLLVQGKNPVIFLTPLSPVQGCRTVNSVDHPHGVIMRFFLKKLPIKPG